MLAARDISAPGGEIIKLEFEWKFTNLDERGEPVCESLWDQRPQALPGVRTAPALEKIHATCMRSMSENGTQTKPKYMKTWYYMSRSLYAQTDTEISRVPNILITISARAMHTFSRQEWLICGAVDKQCEHQLQSHLQPHIQREMAAAVGVTPSGDVAAARVWALEAKQQERGRAVIRAVAVTRRLKLRETTPYETCPWE